MIGNHCVPRRSQLRTECRQAKGTSDALIVQVSTLSLALSAPTLFSLRHLPGAPQELMLPGSVVPRETQRVP